MDDHSNCCGYQRRDVLRSLVGIPLIASAATGTADAMQTISAVAQSPTSESSGRIDTHAHLWPVEYLDFLEKSGEHITQIARNIRATASPEDLNARFAMMDNAGVRKQVLSATPQLAQTADASTCLAGARMINETYAELVRRHSDRFLAYGAVPLPHVDEAISEGRRCIEKLGFCGIAISTLIAGKTIAADAFLPFYAEMDRLGAVIYVHPTGCGALSPMVIDFKLDWVVGAPIEDSLATLHLLKADIPHRFPNIKFHIAHLGGTLAFLMQRIEDNFANWKAFPRSPTEELKKIWFDTANFHAPALRCMVDTFGADKIVLGSDFPYFQDALYTRVVSYIEKSGLSPEIRRAIIDENAHHLYELARKA